MVDAVTLITQALLVPLIKKTSETISTLALKGIKKNKIVIAFKNESIANEYADKIIKKIFSIRTLSQESKITYLDEIYHPLRISSLQSHDIITISDYTIMPSHTCYCIVGIAGQGKTTIMKKLFLEELVRSDRFSFFITMRDFNFIEGVSCENILLTHLNRYGIECSIDDVTQLFKTKKVILYFDGFDEVPFDKRNNALSAIESVNDKYGCMTITSSRPDTEITRNSNIEIYNVEFLTESDIESIIKRAIKNPDNQEILLSILKSKDFLKSSIKTPILIDVFIVTSSSLRNDPNSIGEYYDGLFSALIYRHDLLKNLNRDKRSTLYDKELERCFSLLSFLSFTRNKHDFSKNSLLDLIRESCDLNKYNQKEIDVYQDMINGTNLIVKDGYDHYVYIHRSIQEYYCAKTISTLDENDKKYFFSQLLDYRRVHMYMNLLVMLSYIDSFDLIRFYIIPHLHKNGCYSSSLTPPLSQEEYNNRLLKHSISIKEDTDYISVYSSKGINGHEIWLNVTAINDINTIINGGEYNSPTDQISTAIMGKHNRGIYKYLIKNLDTINHTITNEREDFIFNRHEQPLVKLINFEIKDVMHLVDNIDEILLDSYKKYILEFKEVETLILDRYQTRLESNISISSAIGKINLK